MTRAAMIVLLLALAGCETMGMGSDRNLDRNAIKACAKRYPPPPQANVRNLGLIPVYLTRSGDVGDPEVQKWFADMDGCVAGYKPPEQKK